MSNPKVCILRSDGTNCDFELSYAFSKFGAQSEFVHVNELRSNAKKLRSYQILALPGGFSYGDDIASGKVLAIELTSILKDKLRDFVEKRRIILGICNGFQTLVKTGLLPFSNLGKMEATLAPNESGHFECRWVKIKIEKSKAKFLDSCAGQTLDIAVNHGEGKFFAPAKIIAELETEGQIFCRYVNGNGKPTQHYPQNPNGAINAIAGVVSSSGRIIGLMPHPEKFVEITQHPNWRRHDTIGWGQKPHGAFIFENLVKFAKSS